MDKQQDVLAILKLYELRRDEQLRAARQWFFTQFSPTSAMDIVALYRGGERASANFRMITSYWDMAASFVLNGGIDRKMFIDAGTEYIFVYSKIADFLPEVREVFREPDFLLSIETLVRSLPDAEEKIAGRKRLGGLWKAAAKDTAK
jgi:hypothetical protein